MVAIREGVLNGELTLAEEVGRYEASWNGIPVPLGHPTDAQGNYVFANTPDIVSKSPGRFYNAHLVGDRLTGELWLDIELAKSLGGDALTALRKLEAGDPIEVSTGYFRDIEETVGEWNGVAYNGIQRNLRPDHVALLLHDVGACNWQMGCGCPRVNSNQSGGRMTTITINVDLSLDDQLMKVYEAFSAKFSQPQPSEPYVREVFTDRVIARSGEDLYEYPYTLDADGNVTFGSPVKVEVVYQPVAGNAAELTQAPEVQVHTNQQEDQQIQRGFIAALKSIFGRSTQTSLSGGDPMSESTPCPMAQNCACTATDTPAPSPADQPASAPATNADTELAALVAEFGGADAVKTAIQTIQANAENEKAALVAEIVANERNAFSEDELKAMEATQLGKLRDSLKPVDFSGRGTPRTNQQAEEIMVSPMPS